jgi:predicted nucleic acid-binding protein
VKYLEEPANLLPRWRSLAELATASPKRWMDAYLAAFALEANIGLVTTDSGFKIFPGLIATLLTPAAPTPTAGKPRTSAP